MTPKTFEAAEMSYLNSKQILTESEAEMLGLIRASPFTRFAPEYGSTIRTEDT